jgi:hypothetical protein
MTLRNGIFISHIERHIIRASKKFKNGSSTNKELGAQMIDWLINRIFRWDTLRNAIFDEVRLCQSVDRVLWEHEKSGPTNLTWSEGDTWYGWTYNSNAKRYYFDDIGNKSLMGLWEDQWLAEAGKNGTM